MPRRETVRLRGRGRASYLARETAQGDCKPFRNKDLCNRHHETVSRRSFSTLLSVALVPRAIRQQSDTSLGIIAIS